MEASQKVWKSNNDEKFLRYCIWRRDIGLKTI